MGETTFTVGKSCGHRLKRPFKRLIHKRSKRNPHGLNKITESGHLMPANWVGAILMTRTSCIYHFLSYRFLSKQLT
uniref:Uncharacterized protein n=1 Tax=Picea glauca TaxID=3330 RepID=A0A101M0W7_PICGL|nr:hypothetical protein ABT39_MTgene4312 [Picea glauca]